MRKPIGFAYSFMIMKVVHTYQLYCFFVNNLRESYQKNRNDLDFEVIRVKIISEAKKKKKNVDDEIKVKNKKTK